MKKEKWEDQVEAYYNRPKGYTGGIGVVRMLLGSMFALFGLVAMNVGDISVIEGILNALIGISLLAWGYEASRNV